MSMILLLLTILAALMVSWSSVVMFLISNTPKKEKKILLSGNDDVPSGDWKTTGITFYGQSKADDNGLGYTGVDLFKHGKANLTFKGKPVFPAAVFQDDGGQYLYKILEVRSDAFTKNKSVYVHVVDVCNSGQDVCKTNTKKHGFLVDLHATGFAYVGNDDGVLKGSFRVVGDIQPNDLPKNVWHGEYIICSCTGTCQGDNVTWKKRGSC